VSRDNDMGLDPYLQMQGLVHEIQPQKVDPGRSMDIEKTVWLLDKVYRYRGLGDGTANLNETSSKLMSNYSACYIQVAYMLRRPIMALKGEVEQLRGRLADTTSGKLTKKETDSLQAALADAAAAYTEKVDLAIGKLDQCVGLMPWDWRPRMLRHEMLIDADRTYEAEKRVKEALRIEPDKVEYLKMYAMVLEKKGEKAELNRILQKLASTDTDPWYAYITMARNYEEMGMLDSALEKMREFQESHPGDRRAAAMVSHFEGKLRAPAPVTDTAAKTGAAAGKG
jgi:tetratricopeptide (TPR) repeat protein